MHVNNFFVCGPKFTIYFRPTWEGRSLSTTFPIFDLWIRSGDIRDQRRKLSEIASDFGRFFALSDFRGQPFQKVYTRYYPWLATG